MIIAISGTAGSGKSTVARILADRLDLKHYSMGDFQREIAKEKGLTIVELGELEKKDPEIDHMVDDKQREIGEREDDFIIDSWLSPRFIPHAFKILLDADIDARSVRIFGREPGEYKDIHEVKEKILQREKTNRERWIEYYDYDYTDKKNYDLVIDTTDKDVSEIVDAILQKIDTL